MKKLLLWVGFVVFVVLAAKAYDMSEIPIALVMGVLAVLFGLVLCSRRVSDSL